LFEIVYTLQLAIFVILSHKIALLSAPTPCD
jgi:hypothetical protein